MNAIVKDGGQEIALKWLQGQIWIEWQSCAGIEVIDGGNQTTPTPASAKRAMEAMRLMRDGQDRHRQQSRQPAAADKIIAG